MSGSDRLTTLLAELQTAGDDWPRVARSHPDVVRVRRGRWQGQAWIRSAVFLAEPLDDYPDTPLVLLLHEDGEWFRKGDRQGRP